MSPEPSPSALDRFSDVLTRSERRVIGAVTLLLAGNLLVRMVTCPSPTSKESALRDADRPPPAAQEQAKRPGKIHPSPNSVDINTASREELMRLPGVGPATADRIIAARPYRRVAELRRVRGIGRKSLQRMMPYLSSPQ